MIKKITPLIFLSLIISCASQPRIDTDLDTTYDLSKYKSFAIEQPALESSPSQIGLNPILLQRVERAIRSSLEKRGLTQSTDADMTVRFLIGTNREIERSLDFGTSFYYDRHWEARSQRYLKVDKNEISIRFHDKKTDEVIWYAFSRFNQSLNIQDQDAVDVLIARAIQKF